MKFDHPEIVIINKNKVYDSLGCKMNDAIKNYSKYELIAVWEDDDIYLPNNLHMRVKYLQDKQASQITHTFFFKRGKMGTYLANSIFYGQIIFTKKIFEDVGGYPEIYQAHDVKFIMNIPKEVRIRNKITNPNKITYIYRMQNIGKKI